MSLKASIPFFNNSIDGVPKILHFALPENFANWDSKVAAVCNYTLHGNRRHNEGAHQEYVSQLKAVVGPTALGIKCKAVKAQIDALDIETGRSLLTRLK